jgi:hypothetical protein
MLQKSCLFVLLLLCSALLSFAVASSVVNIDVDGSSKAVEASDQFKDAVRMR